MPRNRYEENLYGNIRAYLSNLEASRAPEIDEETQKQLMLEEILREIEGSPEEIARVETEELKKGLMQKAIAGTPAKRSEFDLGFVEKIPESIRGLIFPQVVAPWKLLHELEPPQAEEEPAYLDPETGYPTEVEPPGLKYPYVDPTAMIAGGVGSGIPAAIKGTLPLGRLALRGLIAGAAEFPVGTATEYAPVSERVKPYLNVGVGAGIGLTAEPMIERMISKYGGRIAAKIKLGQIDDEVKDVLSREFRQVKQFQVDKPVKPTVPHEPSRWKGRRILTAEDIPAPKKPSKGPAQISAEAIEKEELKLARLKKSPKAGPLLRKQLREEEVLTELKGKPVKKGEAEKAAELFEEAEVAAERLRRSKKGALGLKKQLVGMERKKRREVEKAFIKGRPGKSLEQFIKEKRKLELKAKEIAQKKKFGKAQRKLLVRPVKSYGKKVEGGFAQVQVAQHLAGAGIGASVGYAADDENPIRGALIGAALGTASPMAIKGAIKAFKRDPGSFKGGKLSDQSVRRIIDGGLADNKSPDEILKMIEEGNKKHTIKMDMGDAKKYINSKVPKAKLAGIEKLREKKLPSDSPAWEKVHGMIGKEETSAFNFPNIVTKLTKAGQKFNEKILDRFAPIKEVSPSTYEAARKFSSHKDIAARKLDNLVDIFEPVRKEEVLITDYIDAHRALTRAERGLKNPNNVTVADAKRAIVEMEKHYKDVLGKDPQVLKNVLIGFQKWTDDHILKEALDSGILSKTGYDDIVKNNRWYAAFDVLDHMPDNLEKIPMLKSREYFSVANQNIIKKMVGTEKKIANPIEATIRKFAQAQTTFARNKVASEFINDPNARTFFRPVAMSKKQFAIMKNQGLDPVMSGQWNKDFDVVNHFSDGKVNRYVVPKEVAEAMKQLTPFQAPRVVQALNNIFRKSATTVYLPFTISNAFRDAFMAYTTSPVYRTRDLPKFAKDWGKGFWEGAKHEFGGKSGITKEYIDHGGGFGYVGELRQATLAKKKLFGMKIKPADIIKSPMTLLEKVSSTIELAPRIGIFERAKILNHGLDDAALLARQGTIDFNRGGTWTKTVNQFVPFLNARIQGRLTLASALKRDPKGTLSKIFISAVVPGMAAYAWNRLYYSDLYDDIPETVKQNYFTVITGTSVDKHGRKIPRYTIIPKGDVGQIAFNPLEFGMDRMWKKDKKGTAAFLINYLSDLSPIEFTREGKVSPSKAMGGLLPPIAKGFAEDWANLKFYQGREIVPYWMGKSKPPELQYKEWTPNSYKWLGKKMGISPLRIQNFASNIFAGYGREGFSPASMLRGLTGRVIRTQGGEIQSRAFIVIKDIENGYKNTRAWAEEFIKNGEPEKATDLLNKWNEGLKSRIEKFDKEFEKYGVKDEGGLFRSYNFTSQKRNYLFRSRLITGSPLERRLRRTPVRELAPTRFKRRELSR